MTGRIRVLQKKENAFLSHLRRYFKRLAFVITKGKISAEKLEIYIEEFERKNSHTTQRKSQLKWIFFLQDFLQTSCIRFLVNVH